MESETLEVNPLYSVALKPVGLSCTLNGSFTHSWFCNIDHLGDIASLNNVYLPNFDMFWYTILKNYIDITTDQQKNHYILEPWSSLYWIQVFKNFNICLKVQILSPATNAIICFPGDKFSSIYFWENVWQITNVFEKIRNFLG